MINFLRKIGFYLVFVALIQSLSAQQTCKNFQLSNQKKDSIVISLVSISSINFKVLDNLEQEIPPGNYQIDFAKAVLKFKKNALPDTIKVCYIPYPDFLTKTYGNPPNIIPNSKKDEPSQRLIYQPKRTSKTYKPFEGIDSQSEITRRFTVGNNQDGVLNSTLNLQLSGKLSEKVSLKASVINTDLPIQENGNTFEVNDFNRVFVELQSSDGWQVNAGDLFLKNTESKFLRFNKRVIGLDVQANFGKDSTKINAQASGAVVRGKYNRVAFTGIEGNQGPYQLSDFQDQYIRMLSDTERIYLNGRLLNRGADQDYTINYDTSEITFNSLLQITADMRFQAEYQYFNQDFNRFSSYNQVGFGNEKLSVNGYFFYETDAKESAIQQDLSDTDKIVLATAGDDTSLMNISSFSEASNTETGIFYEQKTVGADTFFEFSTDSSAVLYNVNFSFLGENLGAYRVKEIVGDGTIYEFVGEGLGAYQPIVQLTAPDKIQIMGLQSAYQLDQQTSFHGELALSHQDVNLFSDIDDEDNQGFAAKIGFQQAFFQREDAKLSITSDYEFIDQYFRTLERVQSIEFNRDWNIQKSSGSQQLFKQNVDFSSKKTDFKYQFQRLELGRDFKAKKHNFSGKFIQKNIDANLQASYLNSDQSIEKGAFLKALANATYHRKKAWLGTSFEFEENKIVETTTQQTLPLSHRFADIGARFGVGDSTKVFVELGTHLRTTDSVRNARLDRVNHAQNYFLNTRLSKNDQTLTADVSYRKVNRFDLEKQSTLNSNVSLVNLLFKNNIQLNTRYQTVSGNLPQQDFRYVATAEGQGFYTWNDYNSDGIQDLNEFEVAQFPDEANYLRVLQPTLNYLPTHQNTFSQELQIRPKPSKQQRGWGRVLSKFQADASINIQSNRSKTSNSFNLNPFDLGGDDLLGLNYRLSNSLKYQSQKFKAVYSYLDSAFKNISIIDTLSSESYVHKLLVNKKLNHQIHFELMSSIGNNSNTSVVFADRNYRIQSTKIRPSFAIKHGKQSELSIFYDYKRKKNQIDGLENLDQHNFGLNYSLSSEKTELSANFNYIQNDYQGLLNSPTAYQLLEGLQPGRNLTWSAVLVKKVNSFLNLDLNYLGRASSSSRSVHTGSVQLRAVF